MPETPAVEHHEETPPPGAPVDSSGKPEGPVQQAVEKSKNENRIKAGLALAAIGIVVAVVLARRASANSAAPSPNAGGYPAGPLDSNSSGLDNSYIQSLQGQLGGLSSQITQLQGAQAATRATLVNRAQHQAISIAELRRRLLLLQKAENAHHTPAEIRAHHPVAPARARPVIAPHGKAEADRLRRLAASGTPQQRADMAAWLQHNWN